MKFSKYLLGDLVKIQSSKRVYHKDYVEVGIPFYRSKEIIEKSKNKDISTSLFISEEYYNELESKNGAPKEGDMLLTSVGTIGVPYLVTEEDRFYFKDGNLTWFSDFSEYLNNKYLFHWIRSSIGRNKIDSIVIGSTQKALTMVQLKKIEIEVPEIGYQNRVVNILDSIENKIVMNYKMIDTLEEMASTLFKRWFVDFEFPDENGNPYKSSGGKMIDSELGEIPEGFTVNKLNEVVEVKYGKDHKKLSEGNYPVYGSGGLMRVVDKYLYTGESVLIPRKGSLNNIMYVNESFWTVDTMFFTKMKMTNVAKYIYLTLIRIDFSSMNVGSAVPSMTTAVLNDLSIVIPSNNVLNDFDYRISTLFQQKKSLEIENKKLSALRDTLLPKLLSGEIEL